jgi:hypothetical protein
MIFTSFGLFSPRNATVVDTLFVCALSVSGAIFLILELDSPFSALLQISDLPLRDAIARIRQRTRSVEIRWLIMPLACRYSRAVHRP